MPRTNDKKKIARMQTAVGAAMRNWYKVAGSTDEDLLLFLLLVQQELNKQSDFSLSSQRLATNNILQRAMDKVAEGNADGIKILKLRFQDERSRYDVAEEMFISSHTVSHKQREAIDEIAALLLVWEDEALQEKAKVILSRLPSPSSPKLFGVDEKIAILVDELLKPQEPWLTAVMGIGGIGKTSLALAVAKKLVREFCFENVVWVRLEPGGMKQSFESPEMLRNHLVLALDEKLWPESRGGSTPQQRLTRVRHALKKQRILVVVDNIESAMEATVVVECLNNWRDPSKFLLTSRFRPQGAFDVSLNQLPPAVATEMVRYYLRQAKVIGAEAVTEADMDAIYQHTGGNPQALKLVVSLLDTLPLPRVLAGLLSVNMDDVEEMYRHIYWQSWQAISEAGRTLLEAMMLVAKGGADLDYLQEICEMEERPFHTAITELRQRSLIEVEGDLYHRRYSIHPLTKSFLQTEIVRWPLDLSPDTGLLEE